VALSIAHFPMFDEAIRVHTVHTEIVWRYFQARTRGDRTAVISIEPMMRLANEVGIPIKLNALSEGKPNGIPG
jgi:hypothetical protein